MPRVFIAAFIQKNAFSLLFETNKTDMNMPRDVH